MFYVYYLLDPETKCILYIGRTNDVSARVRAFVAKYQISVKLGLCQRHSGFEGACAAELKAIAEHCPFYNKNLVSSLGNYGRKHTEESKQLMRTALVGKSPTRAGAVNSEQHRARIAKGSKNKTEEYRRKLSIALTGRKLTEETKAKLRKANLGKKYSEESKEKKRNAMLGRRCSPETILKMKQAAQRRVAMKAKNEIPLPHN